MADKEERTYYTKTYISNGFVPIPIGWNGDINDKYCGKKPLGQNWQLVTLDEASDNFERANRRQAELNIGLRTGKDSNLIVIDVDLVDSGMEYYHSVLEPMLRLNNCDPPMIQTGSGGYHLYFSYTPYAARLVSRSKLPTPQGLVGIDLKTNGAYVIAVPSRHRSGNHYSFLSGNIMVRPEMPNWLVDFLQPLKVRPVTPINFTPRYRYSEIQIIELLNLLSDYRADSYTEWRDVCFSIGRSLQQSPESLLIMRDFSKRSRKCHDRGNEQKIADFYEASYRENGYSINHLIELAQADNPDGLRDWKERYPIKNAIERALRRDSVNSTTNAAPPSAINLKLRAITSATSLNTATKTLLRIKDLMELIQPVAEIDQLTQIVWAIVRATNRTIGYADIVHEFAIKSLNANYSIDKVAEMIKSARSNGTGYRETFLENRAKADNPAGYEQWLTKYKAKKVLTKEERLQADEDQKLTNPELADLIVEGFGGKDTIFYYQDEWYQWVEQDQDGSVMLWVNRKVNEIIAVISRSSQVTLRELDFNKDNVIKYSKITNITAILALIQVVVTMKKWPETAAWDLPIQNGRVLNLKTGKVRNRTHQDYFTFECKIDLELVTSAGTMRVDKFFQTTSWGQGDGFKDWLINYCLYALSGELNPKRPNVLSIEGLTRNGKSTLISTIRKVLGVYSGPLPSAVLFDSDNVQRAHDTHLLQIRGKRCVIFSEIGDKPVNMETLKRITGGDELTARGANERKFVDFESFAKILIVANNRLNVDFTDSISRRVKCIELKAQFFDEPELWDEAEGRFEATDIKDWLASAEGLACFVDYLVKNGQEGQILALPDILKQISLENTENTRPNHEIFIEEWLAFDHSGIMKLDQIWEHYIKWLKARSPSKTKNNLPASLKLKFPDVYHAKSRSYRLKLRDIPQLSHGI